MNEIKYEYACEYVKPSLGGDGDILDTDYSNKLIEVWPAQWDHFDPCTKRLCVIRYKGNEDDGELERGYAYTGDTHFCSGQKVPNSYLKALESEQ